MKRMAESDFDITLRVRSGAIPPGGIGHQRCLTCDAPLAVHQPDLGAPHRLLAHCTSRNCGAWFAITLAPDGESLSMMRLPSVGEMLKLVPRGGVGDGVGKGDGHRGGLGP